MNDLVKVGAFLLFLALGFLVISQRGKAGRRKAVNTLLGYLVGIHIVIAVTNRGGWPFATYPLVPSLHVETMPATRWDFRGVDEHGREYDVHPDSFSPVFELVLSLWFVRVYPTLPADQQRVAVRYLANRAETSRQRLSAGYRIGPQRFLGRFAAPDWWLYPVPPQPHKPFRAFRVYRIVWVVGNAYRNPAAMQRDLIAEFRW